MLDDISEDSEIKYLIGQKEKNGNLKIDVRFRKGIRKKRCEGIIKDLFECEAVETPIEFQLDDGEEVDFEIGELPRWGGTCMSEELG